MRSASQRNGSSIFTVAAFARSPQKLAELRERVTVRQGDSRGVPDLREASPITMLWSAFNFSLNKEMRGAFAHFGLPDWFRIELTVAKILGALALLIPTIPNRIKEFAYCGFAITLISAVIAHSSSGDGMSSLDPLLFLGILIVSYFYYYKAQLYKQPAGSGTLRS